MKYLRWAQVYLLLYDNIYVFSPFLFFTSLVRHAIMLFYLRKISKYQVYFSLYWIAPYRYYLFFTLGGVFQHVLTELF